MYYKDFLRSGRPSMWGGSYNVSQGWRELKGFVYSDR